MVAAAVAPKVPDPAIRQPDDGVSLGGAAAAPALDTASAPAVPDADIRDAKKKGPEAASPFTDGANSPAPEAAPATPAPAPAAEAQPAPATPAATPTPAPAPAAQPGAIPDLPTPLVQAHCKTLLDMVLHEKPEAEIKTFLGQFPENQLKQLKESFGNATGQKLDTLLDDAGYAGIKKLFNEAAIPPEKKIAAEAEKNAATIMNHLNSGEREQLIKYLQTLTPEQIAAAKAAYNSQFPNYTLEKRLAELSEDTDYTATTKDKIRDLIEGFDPERAAKNMHEAMFGGMFGWGTHEDRLKYNVEAARKAGKLAELEASYDRLYDAENKDETKGGLRHDLGGELGPDDLKIVLDSLDDGGKRDRLAELKGATAAPQVAATQPTTPAAQPAPTTPAPAADASQSAPQVANQPAAAPPTQPAPTEAADIMAELDAEQAELTKKLRENDAKRAALQKEQDAAEAAATAAAPSVSRKIDLVVLKTPDEEKYTAETVDGKPNPNFNPGRALWASFRDSIGTDGAEFRAKVEAYSFEEQQEIYAKVATWEPKTDADRTAHKLFLDALEQSMTFGLLPENVRARYGDTRPPLTEELAKEQTVVSKEEYDRDLATMRERLGLLETAEEEEQVVEQPVVAPDEQVNPDEKEEVAEEVTDETARIADEAAADYEEQMGSLEEILG